MDPSLPEHSSIQVDDIVELLDICLTTIYFQFEDEFHQKKDGISMGNPLSPVGSSIFIKHFEEIWIQQTTNLLNRSDTLMMLSWFAHMDQQDCSNFFTISAALDLPSNSQ
jgi:hypothetical protein